MEHVVDIPSQTYFTNDELQRDLEKDFTLNEPFPFTLQFPVVVSSDVTFVLSKTYRSAVQEHPL